MAGERPQDLHLDQFLTNFAISYLQSAGTFVQDQVSPRLEVKKESDKYPVWDKEEDFRIDDDAMRRPSGESTEIDVTLTKKTFQAEGYAKHVKIGRRELNNSDDVFDLRRTKTARLTHRMLGIREKRIAGIVNDSNNIGTSIDLSAGPNKKWSDNTGDPFKDLETGLTAVYNATGVVPNRMLIPFAIAIRFRNHDVFVNRFKSWTGTVEGMDLPPDIMGLKPVVAKPLYNTTKRGPGRTATLSPIWGNNVTLYYVQDDQIDQVGVETLTSYKSFWVKQSSGTYNWWEPRYASEMIEQEEVIAEVVTAADTVYQLQNVI